MSTAIREQGPMLRASSEPLHRYRRQLQFGLTTTAVSLAAVLTSSAPRMLDAQAPDFDPVPLRAGPLNVLALRRTGRQEYLIIPSRLRVTSVVWFKHYDRILFWRRLQGSRLLVSLEADDASPDCKRAEAEIRADHPDAAFYKLLMRRVRPTVLSPWIESQPVAPLETSPIGTVSLGWVLGRHGTKVLESQAQATLVIAGSLDFQISADNGSELSSDVRTVDP